MPGKLHLIADALSQAPHFPPHADELTVKTSFAILSEQHLQSIQLLNCMSEHICPQHTDLLVQIQSNFSSPNIGSFASSYKKHGKRLSIYKLNNIKFVLLDSRQIIPPPGAVLNLLKNLHSVHVGVDRTMSLTKQLFFWHGMLMTTINSCKACQLYVPTKNENKLSHDP